MRYQCARSWATRCDPDTVMAPFATEVLERAAAEAVDRADPRPSKLSDRHQVLMRRCATASAPCRGLRVEPRKGRRFATQKDLLRWSRGGCPPTPRSADGRPVLRTADLIALCQERGWDYRLRLKGTLVVRRHREDHNGGTRQGQGFYLEDVELTRGVPRPTLASSTILVMTRPGSSRCAQAGYLTTLAYSERWGIEPMFSDFKSRGFGIDNTQLRYPDRLARLLLVLALALYSAVSTGRWDKFTPPPRRKKHLTRQPAKVARSKVSWFPEAYDGSQGSCRPLRHCHLSG